MITFSFGRNWKRYIAYVANPSILQLAEDSLVRFFGKDFDFSNKIFLDIGCGSGLFSIAALRLGVARVISIDVDKNSIEATLMALDKFKHLVDASLMEVLHGSILDADFCAVLKTKLAQYQKEVVVYSWGVLHHTGNLALASANVMSLLGQNYKLAGGGANYAYISLYNKTEASSWWLGKKQYYNKTNRFMKFLMVFAYAGFITFEDIRKGRGLNLYDKSRGMYKITDIIDWLGGLPYEPIHNDAVIKQWEEHGFTLLANKPTVHYNAVYPKDRWHRLFVFLKVVGLGCNEFLFAWKFR